MLTLYQLKPRFQALLRPGVAWLAAHGVTANAVTLAAMLLSLALGAGLCLAGPQSPQWFLLLPGWMLARMALNAVDGMLAREFGQQSALGAYLNELADVLADAALFAPFALQPALGWPAVCTVIVLSGVSEMAGALGPMVGALGLAGTGAATRRGAVVPPWPRAWRTHGPSGCPLLNPASPDPGVRQFAAFRPLPDSRTIHPY